MRVVVSLARGGLIVFLLACVVLGSLTACSWPGVTSMVASVAVAEVVSEPAVEERSPSSPVGSDPYTPENPCQHVPGQARSVEHSVGRTGGAPCGAVPAVTGTDLGPRHPLEGPGPAVSTSSPVPPVAVRAPVATLCVDRN